MGMPRGEVLHLQKPTLTSDVPDIVLLPDINVTFPGTGERGFHPDFLQDRNAPGKQPDSHRAIGEGGGEEETKEGVSDNFSGKQMPPLFLKLWPRAITCRAAVYIFILMTFMPSGMTSSEGRGEIKEKSVLYYFPSFFK